MRMSYDIIPNREAIIRAAATVRCLTTITANVGTRFKLMPTNTGKPAATAESVYPNYRVFSS